MPLLLSLFKHILRKRWCSVCKSSKITILAGQLSDKYYTGNSFNDEFFD